MRELPTGTVTFLVTDIENSSQHWEDAAEEMRVALALHDTTVNEVVDGHGGAAFKHVGDGIWAVFHSAPAAAEAAVEIQRRLQAAPESLRPRLRVRIGLHSGDAVPTDGDYFGPTPNRVARVTDLANGGQIVCSSACAGLLSGHVLHSQGTHELRGIGADEIFLVWAADIEIDSRPLRRPVLVPNLPRVRTSFLGRDDDVDRVLDFLREDHAVVTLMGPGGVGKTRLAVEVGRAVAADTDAVVRFCDLADIREPGDVFVAVADVIGARQQPAMDLLDSIADYAWHRELVIILDNCEQVVEPVTELVARLAEAEGVDLLATSRAALHAVGEQIVDVEPLDPDTVGIELFVSRAREHDPSYELDHNERPLVGEITERLDGIPLAIELAAARIRLMTPAELIAGLDQRFSLLRSGEKRGRHETLGATVSWSYDLLTPREAAVFVRMSVFAGGAELAAIQTICADDLVPGDDIPDVVLSLVEKSMVASSASMGHRRFRLLETMRGFGDQVLAESGERERYRERHAEYFGELASAQWARLYSPAEPDVWRVLDNEWANLRLAFDAHVTARDLDRAARLVTGLVDYATYAMRFELFGWADELLELPGVEETDLFTDLCGIAALGAYFTVSGRVTELAEAGLAADPGDPFSWCRTALGAVFLNNVHTEEASDALTSAFLASEPTTIGGRLWAHGLRTFHLCSYGRPAEAAPHAATISRLANESGSVSAQALAAWARGLVVTFSDLDAAIGLWTDALEGPRSMPRSHLLRHLLVGLKLHFTVHQEPVPIALEHCRAAVQDALDDHYYAGASHLFGVTAIALCRAADPITGARLVGAMEGNGHLPRDNAIRALDRALGDDVELHKAAGMAMSVTQAAHVALAALDDAYARAHHATPVSATITP